MQSFTYKGQKYSFSDGTSNEDALVKIKTHLGESEEKTTSVGEDLATGFAGVGNLADTGLSLAVSALARPFIGQEADNIFKDLNTRIEERNKWANPEGKKQTTGSKLISAIPGALGIPLAGLNIAGTGKEMLDAGESLPKSLAAGTGDAALQFATMGIPMPGKGVIAKAASTGAFNAGQNFLTDLGISSLADTAAIKKSHDPFDLDKALVSGVSGAVAGGAFHKYETNSARKLKDAEAKFDAGLKAALDAKKIVPPVEKVPTQMELPLEVSAQQIAERRGADVGQPDLFGPQNIPRAELDGAPIADQVAMRRAIERDALLKAQQESLPLASSPEQIAEMQNRNSPQADMFGAPKDTTPGGMQARQEQKQLSAYERAQQQLAERQAALEFEVRRQAALDNGAAERARQEQAPTGFNDWQVGKAADEAAQTHDFLSRAQQAEIDATPHGDRPAQYGFTDTGGRVDENGIPIRADLSMEAQNLQDPLQRNLWGDELPRKSEQEAPLGLTEAIDNALAQLQNGISVPKGQRGGFDFEILPKAFRDFVENWHQAGGNFSHVGVSRMLDDHPVKLKPEQRRTLAALYPDVAKTYQDKIDRAWEQTDEAKARRFGKRYDDALIAEAVLKQYDAFGKGFKLNGPRYDAKTGPYAGKVAAQEAADAAINMAKINGPKNQRGAIDFGPAQKEKQDIISKIVGEKYFTAPPTVDEITAQSLASGKDGTGWNLSEAGGSLTAEKRNSPLIRGGVRIIQHQKNIAENEIRTSVFPAEKRLRSLSSTELVQLAKVMKAEMFAKQELSTKELADLGLSTKQLQAYEATRAMYKEALARENEARALQGKEPITASEAYLSSRWQGDFRRAVYSPERINENGKVIPPRLVWYLAANSKKGLDIQSQALVKQFPELAKGEHKDHVVRSTRGSNQDAQSMYTTMLDVLGRDDPAVQKIKEWAESKTEEEGRGVFAQEKHFENKSNVRGFVGDRPSNTLFGKLNPQKEALEMFQQQITYAKNAHKWSGMQAAGKELKQIFSNEELAAMQPHNMEYLKDYFREQVGMGTAKSVSALEDAFKGVGISPRVVNEAIGSIKNLWITQKLVASLGFMASNVIQAGNMLPHITDMQRKYGGNPLYAVPLGLTTGLAMAMGHISNATGRPSFYKFLGALPAEDIKFMTLAMKYAEDNSVIARSIYDESPIASSFSTTSKIMQGAGKTISSPETILRSVTFMTYANMLKSSGKFKNDLELLREAEERTNISMGDYREGEKAMAFSKLGTLGNAMNTLQTFPINYYNQWSWAAREAKRGNPAPAAVMFMTQAAVAGAMGIPGFADADKLWNGIKGLLADHSPKMWDKVKDVDLKQGVLNGFGSAGLYGPLSTQTGVSFTSRASAPAISEMSVSPLSPIADLGRQAGSFARAAADPADAQKRAQSVMDSIPTGLQGWAETGPLRDQTSVRRDGERVFFSPRDLTAREGSVARTPAEEKIRQAGFRSQREVEERDATYRARNMEAQSNTVIRSLPGKIYNELRKGDVEEAKSLIVLYAKLSGKEITEEQIQAEAVKEFTTGKERASIGAKTIPGILAIKRLQEIQNATKP